MNVYKKLPLSFSSSNPDLCSLLDQLKDDIFYKNLLVGLFTGTHSPQFSFAAGFHTFLYHPDEQSGNQKN